MPKDSFILYTKYSDQISLLTMEQAGTLFVSLLNYQSGKPLPKMDAVTEMCFSFIKAQIDTDNEKYEETVQKRIEAGKTGGAPKGNQNAKKQANDFELPEKQAKQAQGCFEEKKQPKQANVSEKQPKQAKQPVYVNEGVNDICPSLSEREEILVSKNQPRAREKQLKDLPPSMRSKDLQEFLKENPKVIIDSCPIGMLSGIDFAQLREKYRRTPYLRDRPHELSWICKNSAGIIGGAYQAYESDNDGNDLTEAERKANEEWFDRTFGSGG